MNPSSHFRAYIIDGFLPASTGSRPDFGHVHNKDVRHLDLTWDALGKNFQSMATPPQQLTSASPNRTEKTKRHSGEG